MTKQTIALLLMAVSIVLLMTPSASAMKVNGDSTHNYIEEDQRFRLLCPSGYNQNGLTIVDLDKEKNFELSFETLPAKGVQLVEGNYIVTCPHNTIDNSEEIYFLHIKDTWIDDRVSVYVSDNTPQADDQISVKCVSTNPSHHTFLIKIKELKVGEIQYNDADSPMIVEIPEDVEKITIQCNKIDHFSWDKTVSHTVAEKVLDILPTDTS